MLAGNLLGQTDCSSEVSSRAFCSVLNCPLDEAYGSLDSRNVEFVFEQFKLEVLQGDSWQIQKQFVTMLILEYIEGWRESYAGRSRGAFSR